MRFTVSLGTDRIGAADAFVSGEGVAETARALERAGVDAGYVTDHPAADATWLAQGGHHALEPTVALAFAAAATTTLRLHTNIYVLAYRNPFLAAKALGSLDRLSGGRLIVGVAAGYLRAEFEALGADFDHRNETTDEALALLPRIWSGEPVAAEGRSFTAAAVVQQPTPLARPHPPLWIGGNSRRAIHRAVELGQGWSPFPSPPKLAAATNTASLATIDDLARGIATANEYAAITGRSDPLDVCIGSFASRAYLKDPARPDVMIDDIGRLAEIGVTWISMELPGRDRAEMIDAVERFGADVVTPCRDL